MLCKYETVKKLLKTDGKYTDSRMSNNNDKILNKEQKTNFTR